MYIRKPRQPGHAWEFAVKKDGKRISKTFKDRKSGEVWAKELETNIERGSVGIPQNITLAEGFKNFLENRTSLAPSTHALYEVYWKTHLSPKFGERLMGSITTHDLQAWVGTLSADSKARRKLASATIQRLVNLLRAIYAHAIAAKIIHVNPCKGLALPKLQKVREVRMLTSDEVDLVIEVAGKSPRLLAMVQVCLGTGLRLGELMALRWDWIDEARGVIRVPASLEAGFIPKGKKERDIPLLPDVISALERWRPETTGDGTVFSGVNWRRCVRDRPIVDHRDRIRWASEDRVYGATRTASVGPRGSHKRDHPGPHIWGHPDRI